MKVALLGYGQMGKMIESLAPKHGIEVTEKYWDEHLLEVCDDTRETLKNVPVLIDFSLPGAVLDNVKKAAALSKNIVLGTTGWHQHFDEIQSIVEECGIGLLYASNFSLGINLFYKIAGYAGRLMSAVSNYDPYMTESHHQFKKDAPSGTALVIKELLQSSYQNKDVPVSCVRAGYIPGTHSIGFDSVADTIMLTHTARSRAGFAEGALVAAQWINGKKGIFEFKDAVEDLINPRT